ncbi:MAG TPA: M28 family peptidase [Bryobacteraceae bacterium]|nr:M28 family peptidase [Bryobacteraceae bacterium]
MRGIVITFVALAVLGAQSVEISGERMRAHIKFLADDLLEGRGAGTRGGQLATRYIATQLALNGARPAGDNSTYFQKVPLIGAETQPSATLSAKGDGKTAQFRWLDDFVGVGQRQQPDVTLDGDVVFVGHGISAPEFDWDDYRGLDVAGKVLVLFTNEPPSNDPAFFGGAALTYYGRWTYKYEEAARRGAQAVFIIHTISTAGYPFDVVRSSWGKEDPQLRLGSGERALAFAGWLTEEAGQRLLAMSGKDLNELLAASNSRDFRPIALGIHMRGSMPTRLRPLESENVLALVPGRDPALKDQVVVFTAHWDHLGIGTPVNGDRIYNGAVDNASGCGVLLELARAWSNLNPKPRRSALFLAVTAEEAGLRGSAYYAHHPVVPASKTAVDINFDSVLPFGRTKDVFLTGADRTTLWPLVQRAASELQVEITPEAHPEQGHYYRSDHFSMAQAGIPAFTISLGTKLEGKPASYGEQVAEEFNAKHYHQPSDEYDDNWNMNGMEQVVQLGLRIGLDAANRDKLPSWRPGDEFLPAREASGVK